MNKFEERGLRPSNVNPRYAPIFVPKTFTGLWTQRSILHDPSDLITAKFYGGRPEALWDGLNIELTNSLTLARRPGIAQFSGATYTNVPDRAFSFNLTDGTIKVLIDCSDGVYLDNQDGTKTLICTKASGAGQAYFLAVGDTCYIGDGVDLIQYTPTNANGTTWNWGIEAPAAPPTVTIQDSGAGAVAWTASTFFSTMGLLVDSNNNIQFLTSVDASGTNTTQYGLTGQGAPAFSTATGVTTTDNTVTWTCGGPVGLWKANTSYAPKSVIFVPNVGGTPIPSTAASGLRGLNYPGTTGGGLWTNLTPSGGLTSGPSEPKWNPKTDTRQSDGNGSGSGGTWNYLGAAVLWQPSTQYNSYWEFSNEVVVTPTLPNEKMLKDSTQTIYVQFANVASTGSHNTPGTSGTGYTPVWASSAGETTGDNDLIWINLGSKSWAASTSYYQWSVGSSTFSALVDGNGNFQVCLTSGQSGTTVPMNGWLPSHSFALNDEVAVFSLSGWVAMKATTAGTSGSSEPSSWNFTTGNTTTDGTVTWTSQGTTTANVWGQSYGTQTVDGSATWVNCGPAAHSTWVASTKWYLPLAGFAPPSASQPFGGAQTVAGGNVNAVVVSGLSGSSAPTWPSIGSQVTDGTATWQAANAYSSNSMSWTKGHVWAYSYGARESTDSYNTSAPPGYANPLGTPTGSLTGGISTASPVFTVTGSNSGAVVLLQGIGSADPQVDTIFIWQDADGGGASNMFLLTEIPNPPPVNGQPQPWSFQTWLPDTPTSQYPGLNSLIPAPIDSANDPPPAGFLPMSWHFQRIWGAQGTTVYCSGGPDVLAGNPNESYNPLDYFPYLQTVVRTQVTSAGLLVCQPGRMDIIGGGPSTASFASTIFAEGLGLASYNAMDVFGGEIYFFSSDSKAYAMSPNLQISEVGFPTGDKLGSWNSSDAYVAVYRSGTDSCVFFADGSTGWYRLNPSQVPQMECVWSPYAAITGGCKMVQSVQTAPGVTKLLVGSTSGGQSIGERSLSAFTDFGTAYDAWFWMGAITLCHASQLALLDCAEFDFTLGATPTVSYLLDETGTPASWTSFPSSIAEPPGKYGPGGGPVSYSPKRYYFSENPDEAAACRFLSFKVDFGSTTNQDAMLTFCLVGAYVQEK